MAVDLHISENLHVSQSFRVRSTETMWQPFKVSSCFSLRSWLHKKKLIVFHFSKCHKENVCIITR